MNVESSIKITIKGQEFILTKHEANILLKNLSKELGNPLFAFSWPQEYHSSFFTQVNTPQPPPDKITVFCNQ